MNTLTTAPDLLIVDDDPLIREGLAVALSNDFGIHQAETRAAAIELLRELPAPPQLALIDLGLPPFPHRPDEGFQLIAELLVHSPEIRIFACPGKTSRAMPATRAHWVRSISSPNPARRKRSGNTLTMR